MFKTILVPTDGSELSDKAASSAVEFARISGAKIIGLSVAEPYPFVPMAQAGMPPDAGIYEKKMQELAQLNVQKVAAVAQRANVPCEALTAQSFSPAEEIVKTAAAHGCDAIFMASHGRKGIGKLFLGSETQKVLARSVLPVLVFR